MPVAMPWPNHAFGAGISVWVKLTKGGGSGVPSSQAMASTGKRGGRPNRPFG
ncbi:MAG: hypothetical protein QOI28_3598 [Mycobacterium sp.]|jgi:hypothetical protein|nr:hypothetical protein [Mycobacterium sp.]